MDNSQIYVSLFNQALTKIKETRNANVMRPEMRDLGWNKVCQSDLFNFSDFGLFKYTAILNKARSVSMACINAMVILLMEQYGYTITEIPEILSNENNNGKIKLALHDEKNNILLLFQALEDAPFWKLRGNEQDWITTIMQKYGIHSCKHIYYMHDYAYLQVIGHNDDQNDPGRGYNLYSLYWFWNEYFGPDEYQAFYHALNEYNADVKNYSGYYLMKSLTPNTLLNFKKIVKNRILTYPYEHLLSNTIIRERVNEQNSYSLPENDYLMIKQQFISEEFYNVLLGTHDFSESIITAEWLYDSLRKAQAIDLTVIGMGYFKAVEQLMWELICLHKNEGKQIKSIELNDSNIENGLVDNTLGAMATFYKTNLSLFRYNLSWQAKHYIREALFCYKDKRNEYIHKNNIRDWAVIDDIRYHSFSIMFMLVGALTLSEQEKESLGYEQTTEFTDFYRLCEYVNYHSNDVFYVSLPSANDNIALANPKEDVFFACNDQFATTDANGITHYSGLYFRNFGHDDDIRPYRITEQNVPKEIWLGKLVFPNTEDIKIKTAKVKKIFEDGKFVGPLIYQEEQFEY